MAAWCRRFRSSDYKTRVRHESLIHKFGIVARRRLSLTSSPVTINPVAMQFDDAGFRRFTLSSAALPATARGSGIPFDRQNSVFACSAASTVGPPHRRPVVFDKSGKRRANTPAAPEASPGVRPGRRPKTGPHKKTRKRGSVLTFGVLSKICRSQNRLPFSSRRCRPIVNAQGGVLFCQAPDRRAAVVLIGALSARWPITRAATALRRGSENLKCRRAQSGVARRKISGLQ